MKMTIIVDDPAGGERYEYDINSATKAEAVVTTFFSLDKLNKLVTLQLVPRSALRHLASRVIKKGTVARAS